jgi:predicted Zn-dependent protease
MQEFEKNLLAAQGYAELGMHKDALEELDALPEVLRENPQVLEMRLIILMQKETWREAFSVSKRLCKAAPQAPIAFIHAAFCLHELGRTDEAKFTLLNGPAALQEDPTFHYNLACYECVLGDIESARAHLDRCFSLDKKFREFARTDPDLYPLKTAR